MFGAAKNFMASKAAQTYVNGLISRYGTLRDLQIDAANKRVQLVCELHGETDPIRLSVSYRVQERGGQRFAQITGCACARPWVQHLVEDFVQGRDVEVPGWAVSMI
ncbi:MAG TPA: hypothetical protein VG838_15510 [Opitutaceae bacterium]|nr:hypothetical protein [Opitutaceae bacterium]